MTSSVIGASKDWLVIDAPNLIYRAFHTTGKNLEDGTVFGFLRMLEHVQHALGRRNVAFCFDGRRSKRMEIFPDYKRGRAEKLARMGDEERARYHDLQKDIRRIRNQILPRMGFHNVFYENGYEADDLIASLVRESTWKWGGDAVIVSGDKDLYQLLGSRVKIWQPHSKALFTKSSLEKEFFGISPSQWWLVKATAGCPSDGLPGLAGVGEVTAAKFLRGLLPANSKKALLIESREGQEIIRRNTPLVRLPFKGTPVLTLEADSFSVTRWNRVAEELGMGDLVRAAAGFDPPERVEAARQAGVDRAAGGADPDWKDAAWRALLAAAEAGEPFTADDVWLRLDRAGEAAPKTPAALGPLVLEAARQGIIRKTGRLVRTKFARRHRDLVEWRKD